MQTRLFADLSVQQGELSQGVKSIRIILISYVMWVKNRNS